MPYGANLILIQRLKPVAKKRKLDGLQKEIAEDCMLMPPQTSMLDQLEKSYKSTSNYQAITPVPHLCLQMPSNGLATMQIAALHPLSESEA